MKEGGVEGWKRGSKLAAVLSCMRFLGGTVKERRKERWEGGREGGNLPRSCRA